jgi:ribosomal protein L16 Arg81 hydroxylase
MVKRRYLSQRQLTVLDDLFNSDLDEQGVLDKHKVRRSTYERWLAEELFAEWFNRYVNSVRRRSELLMAKYSCLAAAKLVELTTSEKAETARKACLDIIICQPKIAAEAEKVEKDSNKQVELLSGTTASRLLAAMAEEKI